MKRRGCHLLANLINPNHKATTNALLSTVNNKGSRGGDPIEDLNRQPLDDGDTNECCTVFHRIRSNRPLD